MDATRLASLPEIDAAVWRELGQCVRDRQHPWRTPVLASTDGEVADARTVVLRELNAGERRLFVYTDQRSAKVQQLNEHPIGTLVMWSPVLGWQLRIRARMTVLDQGLAVSSRWARIQLTPGAQDYLSPLPPGAAVGTPEFHAQRAGALSHFSVIEASVQSLDWLELHAHGHRRAIFDAAGVGRWVQP